MIVLPHLRMTVASLRFGAHSHVGAAGSHLVLFRPQCCGHAPQRGFGRRSRAATCRGRVLNEVDQRSGEHARVLEPQPGGPGWLGTLTRRRGAVVGARHLPDPRRRDADRADARGRAVRLRASTASSSCCSSASSPGRRGPRPGAARRGGGGAAARADRRPVQPRRDPAGDPRRGRRHRHAGARASQPWFSDQMRDVIFNSVEVADAYATGAVPEPRRARSASSPTTSRERGRSSTSTGAGSTSS